MTKYYIDNAGGYIGGFDGAEPPRGSIEVSKPPNDAREIYVDGKWTVPESLSVSRNNKAAKEDLDKLDLESIRDIREWVASQISAPQTLKDREALAVDARAKIK